MSVINIEKLVKALVMLRRSAEGLQTAAQQYLDARADPGSQSHWSYDEEGYGTKKTGAALRAVGELSGRTSRAKRAVPITDALAIDIAKTAAELETLRMRIQELSVAYEQPEEPEGVQNYLEDLG